MDSLTQIVLGASVGEVVMGKEAGNRAIVWGAVVGTIPDLDIIPGQFLDTVSQLEFHRGFSHSIIFFILLSPLLGLLISRIYRNRNFGDWQSWASLSFWCLLTHALLDCFTTWGTRLFWPLDYRVAVHSVNVIDPLYTLPFLLMLIAVLFIRKDRKQRRRLNSIALIYSSLYLALTVFNQHRAKEELISDISRQNIKPDSVIVKPTPANSILWSGIIMADDTFYIGYHSVLKKDEKIRWASFPKNAHIYEQWSDVGKVRRMAQISGGYFTVEQQNDTLVFRDLRFGQIDGWRDQESEFVFTYDIFRLDDEWIVRQRENQFKDIGAMVGSLWDRLF